MGSMLNAFTHTILKNFLLKYSKVKALLRCHFSSKYVFAGDAIAEG